MPPAYSDDMTSTRFAKVATVTLGAALILTQVASGAPQATNAAALRIVVLEGEGAINVIQQKTAVAPVVEVRDRNDQPVAGAVVRFVIRGGRASFKGGRTLTLTTNGAGRAAATGLTPTGSGALQMTATASFEGQTAVATITQTNVATLAQATAATGASAGGAGGSATAGGAAAGGVGVAAAGATGGAGGAAGGLSLTTLAITGGAVAGGTVAV